MSDTIYYVAAPQNGATPEQLAAAALIQQDVDAIKQIGAEPATA